MPTTELSPMATVQQKIQDKIKAEFISLIPDEMFQSMVDSTLLEFTSEHKVDTYGRAYDAGDPRRMSPMGKIIREELEKRTKELLTEEMNKLFTMEYSPEKNRQVIGKAMVEMVKENYDEILAGIQHNQIHMIVFQAMQALKQSLLR